MAQSLEMSQFEPLPQPLPGAERGVDRVCISFLESTLRPLPSLGRGLGSDINEHWVLNR